MKQKRLFLMADASLREVIDALTPEQLERAAPAEWSRKPNPTLRDIVAAHAKDEAWIPDVLAGRTIEEVGDTWNGDLLGDDPLGNYDKYHDAASDAVAADILPGAVVHLSYGDFPVEEFFEHVTYYRAFQAPLISKLVGGDYHLPDELIDGLFEQVTPQLDELRAIGVFPPEIEPPAGADRQVQLLCLVGYWTP